jgi:hypothetical protein
MVLTHPLLLTPEKSWLHLILEVCYQEHAFQIW